MSHCRVFFSLRLHTEKLVTLQRFAFEKEEFAKKSVLIKKHTYF